MEGQTIHNHRNNFRFTPSGSPDGKESIHERKKVHQKCNYIFPRVCRFYFNDISHLGVVF